MVKYTSHWKTDHLQVYSSVVLSTVALLCTHPPERSVWQSRNPLHASHNSSLPWRAPPSSPSTVLVVLVVLGAGRRWSHTVFASSFLTYCTECKVVRAAAIRIPSLCPAPSYFITSTPHISCTRPSIVHPRTPGLLPPFGQCEGCCDERGCAQLNVQHRNLTACVKAIVLNIFKFKFF